MHDLAVILTDNDPAARVCERASYLWTCELYVNEILVLQRLKKIIPSTPARSQCCCSVNRRNIRGEGTQYFPLLMSCKTKEIIYRDLMMRENDFKRCLESRFNVSFLQFTTLKAKRCRSVCTQRSGFHISSDVAH